MSNCRWSEETIIDLLLGKVSPISREQFSIHMQECEECAQSYYFWKNTLENSVDAPQARRARQILKVRYLFSRWMTNRWSKRGWAVALSAFTIILLSYYGLYMLNNESDVQKPYIAINQMPIDHARMMIDPDTIEYEIVSVQPQKLKGYAWKNDSTQELLLLVEGIVPSFDSDYQVWFAQSDIRFNAGLLTWENGIARFYAKGIELKKVDYISISIEPKGGSIQPTGPEAMYVQIK